MSWFRFVAFWRFIQLQLQRWSVTVVYGRNTVRYRFIPYTVKRALRRSVRLRQTVSNGITVLRGFRKRTLRKTRKKYRLIPCFAVVTVFDGRKRYERYVRFRTVSFPPFAKRAFAKTCETRAAMVKYGNVYSCIYRLYRPIPFGQS